MKPALPTPLRFPLGLLVIGSLLTGCVNVRYDDEHADRSTRLFRVAVRFNQTFQRTGMAGVAADINDCYRDATVPLIKRFALQDCLSYDFAAFTYDTRAAQVMFHGVRTPPFEPNAVSVRMDKYGRLEGFSDRAETVSYAVNTTPVVMNDIARIPGSFLSPSTSRPRPPLPSPIDTF